MHARVSRLAGSPEQIEEGTAQVRDNILPRLKETKGFRGILNLTDRDSGAGLTVTLWDSEEALRASEEAANSMRQDAAQALGASIVGVERYEVTVNEMA